MYAVATMNVAFREKMEDEWQERKILYVINDITNLDRIGPYLVGGWVRMLKNEKLIPEDYDEKNAWVQ